MSDEFLLTEDGHELINMRYIRRFYYFSHKADKKTEWYIKAEIEDTKNEDHDYRLIAIRKNERECKDFLSNL